MGRRKPYTDPELTFCPRISETSRKLAENRRASVCANTATGVTTTFANGTHYLIDVQKRIESRLTNNQPFYTMTAAYKSPVKYEFESNLTFSPKLNHTSVKIAKEKGPQLKQDIMNKAAAVAARLAEENTFTFQPKVSTTSTKIAESLGTDFMSRQQQHLDKQKKHIEQANLQFKNANFGRLSPVGKGRKSKEKESSLSDTCDSPSPIPPNEMKQGVLNIYPVKGSKSTSHASGLTRLSQSPLHNSNANMVLKRHRQKTSRARHTTVPDTMSDDSDRDDYDEPVHIGHSRSKTMPEGTTCTVLSRPKMSRKLTVLNVDRLKNAKLIAEKAAKHRKVFTIAGPYRCVRESLRKRGWVEKFYKLQSPKKSPRKKKHAANDDDDDYDDDDDDDGVDDDDDMKGEENAIPPWEEEDGIYGIMSRVLRNVTPTFIWTVRNDAIDFKFLRREQMVNHHQRAGSFTTKCGLCTNIRNVHWFEDADADQFFPRCYKFSNDEEKAAFIDDYRLTACQSVLKWVVSKGQYLNTSCTGVTTESSGKEDIADPGGTHETPSPGPGVCTNPECTKSKPGSNTGNVCIHQSSVTTPQPSAQSPRMSNSNKSPRGKKSNAKKKGGFVPMRAIDLALQQCAKFLRFKTHEDLDADSDPYDMADSQWDQFIQWYYQLIHEDAVISYAQRRVEECEIMLERLREICPQLDLDGTRNVWIVKPGAKSRGRGITCYDHLEDMLALVSSTMVMKDSKYVVQKYIERPLLVHNTKFDIRQWFLVTDWNPLTIWFYKDCYLRFCSQQYTLDDFDESIHLSNNAIQKNYENGIRSSELPDDNMWTNDEFKDYLAKHGAGDVWDNVVYPSMKKAITCAMLTTQDFIEQRKNNFELYGADFMMTDDYRTWLIEINSSPSMCTSTRVTAMMVPAVLDDTLKVVIDRKSDKNCDTGRFELAYKQPSVSVPPYIGIDLCVEGAAVKKTGNRRQQILVPENPSANQSPRSADKNNSKVEKPKLSVVENSRHSQISPKTEPSSNTSSQQSTPTKPVLKMTHTSSSKREDASQESVKPSSRPLLSTSQTMINDRVLPVRPPEDPYAQQSHRGLVPANISVVDAYSKTCAECGNGMNLKLERENITCSCRRDSIQVDITGKERLRSAGRTRSRASSRSPNSPTPWMSHMGNCMSQNGLQRHKVLAAVYRKDFNRSPKPSERILLKYTDAGIQRPESPPAVTKSFPTLPKKRYHTTRKSPSDNVDDINISKHCMKMSTVYAQSFDH